MDADNRKRIRREIMKNAALLFGCDYALVSVVTERVGDDSSDWRAIAQGPGGDRLAIRAADDEGSLVALLNEVIDRANGVPTLAEALEHRPNLAAAARLLEKSRLELIKDIREELDQNPSDDDETS